MKYVLQRKDVRATDRFCWIWNFKRKHKQSGVYWFDTWGPIPSKHVQNHVNYKNHRWFGILRDGLFYYVEE